MIASLQPQDKCTAIVLIMQHFFYQVINKIVLITFYFFS
jgi:hypothetical protein